MLDDPTVGRTFGFDIDWARARFTLQFGSELELGPGRVGFQCGGFDFHALGNRLVGRGKAVHRQFDFSSKAVAPLHFCHHRGRLVLFRVRAHGDPIHRERRCLQDGQIGGIRGAFVSFLHTPSLVHLDGSGARNGLKGARYLLSLDHGDRSQLKRSRAQFGVVSRTDFQKATRKFGRHDQRRTGNPFRQRSTENLHGASESCPADFHARHRPSAPAHTQTISQKFRAEIRFRRCANRNAITKVLPAAFQQIANGQEVFSRLGKSRVDSRIGSSRIIVALQKGSLRIGQGQQRVEL